MILKRAVRFLLPWAFQPPFASWTLSTLIRSIGLQGNALLTRDMSGTGKVRQRACAMKILPNLRVNFLVWFASNPLFIWVMPSKFSETSLVLFVRIVALWVLVGPWTLIWAYHERSKCSSTSTNSCNSIASCRCTSAFAGSFAMLATSKIGIPKNWSIHLPARRPRVTPLATPPTEHTVAKSFPESCFLVVLGAFATPKIQGKEANFQELHVNTSLCQN